MGKAKKTIIFGETGVVKKRFDKAVEFRGAVTGKLYFTRKPGIALMMDKRDHAAFQAPPKATRKAPVKKKESEK